MFAQGAKAVKALGRGGGQECNRHDGIAPTSDKENESGIIPALNARERTSFLKAIPIATEFVLGVTAFSSPCPPNRSA
jgi:hypothetical protein